LPTSSGGYDRLVTDSGVPRFPAGFDWGVATSAYQIEGAVAEDGRGESIWDTFCRRPDVINDGSSGEIATDSYHRWQEDVALLADLGVTAYRFSIAWPRVQPAGTGPASQAGLDYYSRLADGLLEHGITPVPTLYHWDLPQPLEDSGGWLARDTAYRFADYAALAAGRLADRVGTWITLNEPYVVTAFGYALGIHAPGKALMLGALPTAHYQLLGHGLATAALRAAGASQVMITNNYSPAWPATDSEADVAAARAYDVLQNWLFTDPVLTRRYPDMSAFGLDPQAQASGMPGAEPGDLDIIGAPVDGLGVNYYMPTRLSWLADSELPFSLQPVPGYPVTAFGWPVVPAALTELLVGLRDRYGAGLPPVHITENGCSCPDEPAPDGTVDDEFRIGYLGSHLRALHDALDAGVDVRGYYHWTLADNFEWSEGFRQRFGLVHVDHATGARTPKASFGWYRDMIAAQRAAG
jgi:beta-glucosidase